MSKPVTTDVAAERKCLRPLNWNERVMPGDFVEDGHEGFEPWHGPAGFRADMFVKQIYRRLKEQPARTKNGFGISKRQLHVAR
jgi:hypothetical protein